MIDPVRIDFDDIVQRAWNARTAMCLIPGTPKLELTPEEADFIIQSEECIRLCDPRHNTILGVELVWPGAVKPQL